MRYWAIYDEDGKINQTGKSCNDTIKLAAGTPYIHSDSLINPETQYVDVSTGTLMLFLADRPENPATLSKTHIFDNGTDEAVISKVPKGSVVTVTSPNGKRVRKICNDGIIELSSLFMDTFTVKIESFPEQDVKFTVVAE